jgi:tetratricopeptide (TPR) repeat protein
VGLLLVGCQATPQNGSTQDLVDTQFAAYDRDRDDRIDLVEEAPAATHLASADLDRDGAVTREEYQGHLRGEQPADALQRDAVRDEEDVWLAEGNGNAEAAQLPEPDPERTQRAREIYLSGSRLLESSPPQVDRAIREFQQALAVDPLYYRAHFKLGLCYYHRGLYELEINEYRKCLAINRQFTHAWLNLGHAYLARDELERARESYERVLDLEPHHSVALYNKALVEFDLGNADDALRLFRAFLEVDGSGEMGDRAKRYIDELQRRATEGQ